MIGSVHLTDELTPRQRADCEAASYFVLEVSHERYDHIRYLPIEDGEDCGFFSIALGVDGRPPERMWWDCAPFADALAMMQALRDGHPQAALWLRCEGVLAEIEGRDVAQGLIQARVANIFPDDDAAEWLALSRNITAGPAALTSAVYSTFFAALAEHCL